MIAWISMNLATGLVAAIVLIWAIAVVINLVKAKQNHKTNCSGNCSGCAMCGQCHTKE